MGQWVWSARWVRGVVRSRTFLLVLVLVRHPRLVELLNAGKGLACTRRVSSGVED